MACVDASEVEEIIDKMACPFGLMERCRQRLRVAWRDTVDEVLEDRAQGGERRSQLVADVCDQLAALTVDLVEIAGHGVEGPGQVAHLVAGGVGDTYGVVAGRHPSSGGRHLPERRDHADGEQLRDREGERDRDRDAEPHRHAAEAAEARHHGGGGDAGDHE